MNIDIQIIAGPIFPSQPWSIDGAGVILRFDGVVRPNENAKPIIALDYEIYSPMTERELNKLATAVLTDHDILALRVRHSCGRVPVGQCSFRLEIAAAHRKPALAAMDAFIDRMKREVPIWKLPVWAVAEAVSPGTGVEEVS